MRHLPICALATLALAGCSKPAPPVPAALSVTDARVTLSPVPGRPGAAYMTIHGGSAADRLTGIESARIATIELHEGGMRDGMMTMAKVDALPVPAGGVAALAPGGDHAMLFGIDRGVKAGGTLPMTLHFASGAVLETQAAVRAAGTAGAAHR